MTRYLATSLLLIACSKSEPPSESTRESSPSPSVAPAKAHVAPKPLVLTWSDDRFRHTFQIEGGGKGAALARGNSVHITLEKLRKAKYEIGGKTGEVERDYMRVEVDVFDLLGPIAYKDIDKVDTGLTLKLTLPDGRQGETKVPPLSYKFALRAMFEKIENGPVVFGTEPTDPKPSDSLFFVHGNIMNAIIGRASTLQEIDYVATQEKLPETGRKRCSGYTGSVSTITLVLKPTAVTIWDRRTGDVVAKKEFPAKSGCPRMTFTSGNSTSVDSYPPTDKIKAWLKSKIKR